jgi:hypothetical protein
MRLIHAGGFSQLEKQQWRSVLFNNLVMAFQNMFGGMTDLHIDFENDDSKVRTVACEIVGRPLSKRVIETSRQHHLGSRDLA